MVPKPVASGYAGPEGTEQVSSFQKTHCNWNWLKTWCKALTLTPTSSMILLLARGKINCWNNGAKKMPICRNLLLIMFVCAILPPNMGQETQQGRSTVGVKLHCEIYGEGIFFFSYFCFKNTALCPENCVVLCLSLCLHSPPSALLSSHISWVVGWGDNG